MELKVDLISQVMVRPSSPTLHHLRHYRLSFTDEIAPPVYNPWINFYPQNDVADPVKLRTSLSHVLVSFFPLSGRLTDNGYVDCNDKGVPFVETRVRYTLSSFLENPVPAELNKLLPFPLDGPQVILLGVQYNVFDCGGVAVGVCLSHKIGDAASFFTFLNGFAAASRGEPDLIRPSFVSATLFPPKNMRIPSQPNGNEKIVARRLVFDSSSIEAVVTKYSQSVTISEDQFSRRPSRVEVLSAYLWSRLAIATWASSSAESVTDNRFHQIFQYVNLRNKMDPPLPEHAFGNYYTAAVTDVVNYTPNKHFDIMAKMRESLRKVNKELVRGLQERGDEIVASVMEEFGKIKGEVVRFFFSSLCRFPVYEADFGWGKPVWAGIPTMSFINQIVFKDTVWGDGIEALIHLKEEDMVKFEEDEELLPFFNAPISCRKA